MRCVSEFVWSEVGAGFVGVFAGETSWVVSGCSFFEFAEDEFECVVSDCLFGFRCDDEASVSVFVVVYVSFLFEVFNEVVDGVGVVGELIFFVEGAQPVDSFFCISTGVCDELFKDFEEFVEFGCRTGYELTESVPQHCMCLGGLKVSNYLELCVVWEQ